MSWTRLKGKKQHDRICSQLPGDAKITARTEHGIITSNGGSGYRETHTYNGLPLFQIEVTYCRDLGRVYLNVDSAKQLGLDLAGVVKSRVKPSVTRGTV